MASRIKMFRFGIQDDIALLTDVVAVNPFSGDSATSWSTIAENFMDQHPNVALNGRRCRERTQLLLSYFRASDREKLYRSGSEEEYSRKEQLLTELDQLQTDGSSTSKGQNDNRKEEEKKAVVIRKKAMESMRSDDGEVDIEATQTKAKRRRNEMLSYLKEKNENEKQLEKEKLEIERQRVAMEKRRQEMEMERFKLEREERTKMLELLSVLISNKK